MPALQGSTKIRSSDYVCSSKFPSALSIIETRWSGWKAISYEYSMGIIWTSPLAIWTFKFYIYISKTYGCYISI